MALTGSAINSKQAPSIDKAQRIMKETRSNQGRRLRQVTFVICNHSEANVRKIADTTLSEKSFFSNMLSLSSYIFDK